MRSYVERNRDLRLEMLLWAYAPHSELLAGSVSEYGKDYQSLVDELGVVEVGKFRTNAMLSYPLRGRLILSNADHSGRLFYAEGIVDMQGKRLVNRIGTVDVVISGSEEMAFFGDIIRALPDQHLFLSDDSNVGHDTNDINCLYHRFVLGRSPE